MKEYVITHLHTMNSNSILADSPSKLEDYLKEIKNKDGIRGIIRTEHGHCQNWFKTYQLMEKYNYKYIHAVEGYTCLNGDDKYNFHILLYGLNFLGFQEINRLVSDSSVRDGHYYKRPRMFIDDILKCENIAISTSCSGGVFANLKEDSKESGDVVKDKLLKWGIKNKDKFFVEIQPHIHNKQIIVNNTVIKLHKEFGFNIICSNDVHYVNKDFQEIRKIISIDKNSGEESEFELVFDLSIKSYDEQYRSFINLGIEKDIVIEALNNTNKLYDMCEEYKIDCEFKYPQIYENPKETILNRAISNLYKLDYLNNEDIPKYIERIQYEIDVMEHLEALSYINLFSDWLTWCREQGIAIGFGRGSGSSSIINYLTNITGIDSIVWDTTFDRFLNKNKRVTVDIDTDIEPARRQEARDWFFNHPKLNCADILTFNTVAYKGACDTIIRTSELTKQQGSQLKEMYADIRTEFELEDSDLFREKLPISIDELEKRMGDYGDLIKKVVLLEGCIMSVGSHPAGVLVSDLDIKSNIGLITLEDKKTGGYKVVTQCDMKELDTMSYVKADALGLSTVGSIKRTVDYIGAEFPEPQHFNFYDDKVWEDIKKSPCMIFQFEETKAHDYMKIAIDLVNLDKKLQTMSMMSGLIRPSGKSIRDKFLKGEIGDNGHPEIDKAFPDTSQYLVYQENITKFLSMFCGYDTALADVYRKKLSKKCSDSELRVMMSDIDKSFREYFPKHYDTNEEQMNIILENFIEIIKLSSLYGFCYAHAIAYTLYGYIGAYYRYYNTLEFCTANLNEFNEDPNKLKEIYHFINNFTEIKIINPIYPVCKLDYTYDKESNIIHEGMLGAKGVGKNVEIAFNSVDKNIKFNSMKEFIIYIKENEIGINKRELVTLNKMKFFREFGTQNKNEKTILAMYGEKTIHPSRFKYEKKSTDKTKTKKLADLDLLLETIPDTDFNPLLQAFYDLEVFGHTPQRFDNMNEVYYVIDCTKPYSKYIIDLYNIGTGEKVTYKGKDIKKPVKQNLIQILNRELKPDYYVCGEHSDGKPKFLPTGTKSWNVTEYKYIDPENGKIIEKPKKELDKE